MNWPLLVGVGLTIVGLYFLSSSRKRFAKAKSSEHWPSVSGVILSIQVWGNRFVDGKLQAADKLSAEYGYEVNGRSYRSRNLSFYSLMYPQTFEFAQQYAKGSPVTVYYNPDDPSDSTVITGLRKDKPYSDLILSTVGLFAGVALTLAAVFGFVG